MSASSFFHVVFFSFGVWPVVCYAAHATTEKLSNEKFGGRPLAMLMSNAAVWTLGFGMLCAAMYARWLGRPSIHLEYAYVGSVLSYAFFHTEGSPDWDRLGLVAFAFGCVVYTWSDSVLLWYSVVFAFFRSVHVLFPALVKLGAEFQVGVPSPSGWAMRATECVLLGAMCGRHVWTSGNVDPVVFALNFVTVYGHRLPHFIRRRKTHEKM